MKGNTGENALVPSRQSLACQPPESVDSALVAEAMYSAAAETLVVAAAASSAAAGRTAAALAGLGHTAGK